MYHTCGITKSVESRNLNDGLLLLAKLSFLKGVHHVLFSLVVLNRVVDSDRLYWIHSLVPCRIFFSILYNCRKILQLNSTLQRANFTCFLFKLKISFYLRFLIKYITFHDE